ncbi:MAG TPA: glycerophosphodiester phosphodiesterase family protein [Flavisolibacter sp.]|nr:glycerophosphodiester phosphodiesterase family protein [Flavisolibacter sp.]
MGFCRQQKILVIPWTVNSLEEMRRQLTMGVDGIITDYPDLFEKL